MDRSTRKLAASGLLVAIAVSGSLISFPVLGSRCAPVQHMVNIICAVFLGPAHGFGVAFVASFLRNILGLGSLMAFPGSLFGALFSALVYKKTGSLPLTLVGEVVGTALVGGLFAYPVATLLMGEDAVNIAFYAYIFPFFISTLGGAILSALIIYSLDKSGALKSMRSRLRGKK